MTRFLPRNMNIRQDWPIWLLPLGFAGGTLIACALFIWVYFGPGIDSIRGNQLSFSADHSRVGLEIGGALFAIPQNYTRYKRDRVTGIRDNVQLHALFPDFLPYSLTRHEAFLRNDNDAPLLLISLHESRSVLSHTRIFDDIYAPYIYDMAHILPNGLERYHFKPDSPYADYELFRVAQTNIQPMREMAHYFLCRKATEPIAFCAGRLTLGQNVQVSYRFRRGLLAEWEKIDYGIYDLLKSFRRAARKPLEN